MSSAASDAVVPGERVGHVTEYVPGEGTYVKDNYIMASIVGVKTFLPSKDNNRLPIVSVNREHDATVIPEVDSIVIAKVMRVNTRMANVSILVVDSTPCREPFRGIIRVQDIRATEKDKVQVYKSFHPGDIVRAQVISLGDARSYFLSTARNDLGVIFARSEAGASMVPISWQEMQCPKTKVIEFRKCAKPYQ